MCSSSVLPLQGGEGSGPPTRFPHTQIISRFSTPPATPKKGTENAVQENINSGYRSVGDFRASL
jgi:hypothetical protein